MRTAFAFALLISSLSASATLRAEEKQAPIDIHHARDKQADERFAAAVRLHDLGKYVEARAQLEQAYAIAPEVNILVNLAREEQLTGDLVAAIRHYRACLAYPKAELTPQLVDLASKGINELTPRVAHISIEMPADAAEITVDGVVAKQGDVVDVTPGRHLVRAKLDGQMREIDVEARVSETVTARIEPQSTSNFNAPKWITVGAFGVATLTFAVLGAVFKANESSDDDDIANLSRTAPQACSGAAASLPSCKALDDALHRQKTDQQMAVGFFVTSGAFLIATGATALLWKDKPSTRTGVLRIQPSVSPAMLGATIHASF